MSEPLRILIVDDDRAHAEYVRELIRVEVAPDAGVEVVTSYDAAVETMGRDVFDVALFDYLLDRGDGLALLREVRAGGVDTPVVILTGHGAEQVAVEAMKSGAADYLSKATLTGESVGHAIRHAVSIAAAERQRADAERAVRASEERFRALVENSTEFLFLLDGAGALVYTTPGAHRHFGWSAEDLLEQPFLDLVHPDDEPAMRARYEEVRRRPGLAVPAEARIRHADGTYRTIEAVVVNRLHEPPVGAVVINARDVSDRRVLEDQLRQVQKMEAVGRLAGGIAHDFNNLLTAILGYCNLLIEDLPGDSNMRTDVEEIRKAGERAAALTRQLLAFSRRQMLQPQPVDIGVLVEQMQKMIKRLAGEEIDLVLARGSDVPKVKADPSSIEQIVINLAVNARDAMPDGGRLMIATSAEELDEPFAAVHPGVIAGRYVLLAVRDTGAGMDAATRARIFEPFFTTKEQGKGSGLGLATVYGLVKQSGGYIWVESERGAGSVFNVYFPALTPDTERPDAGRTLVAGTETVLLVEDEDTVRALAGEVLRRNGYMVLEARHSLEALRLVERHQESIDLMVTDVVMSHMTGRDLADRIREGRPSMRVLFISGYVDHASVQRELAAGMPFLQKPFTPDGFARKVRDVLNGSVARRLS
jgi:two-component system cell cycle sensor histidine kinase/response regulator CckA